MSYGLAVSAAGQIVPFLVPLPSETVGVGAGVMVGSMVGAIVAMVRQCVNENLAVVSRLCLL